MSQGRIQDENLNREELLAFTESLKEKVIMGFASDQQGKRLVFLCWLLVATFYFYMSYDYIRVSWNGERFADYLTFVVQLAGNENRPAPEIKQLLVGKA